MIAVGVERIDIEACRTGHARAHFLGENAKAQSLRFAEFFVRAGPSHLEAVLSGDRLFGQWQTAARIGGDRSEGQGGRRQVSHKWFLIK
ncbi:hypothetical protein Busp01_01050 [Trinickia caryophylli]|nr:hypothetical protein Busp01_01050 [Trinickia caryophylli]